MLDKYISFEFPSKKGDYGLRLPMCKNWDSADNKILLILETVDSEDLKEKKLLFSRSRTVLTNLLDYCLKNMPSHADTTVPAFAAVNFNNYKFFDTDKDTWNTHRKDFNNRVSKLIEKLKPTTVIVFGDFAAKFLIPDVEFLNKKRGWVFEQNGVKYIPALDLYNLYMPKKVEDSDDEDDGEYGEDKDVYGASNLLFYTSRCIQNAIAGKHLYSLRKIKPKYVYVDTIKKFDLMYDRLLEEPYTSVDTETRNGSVNHNAIHTIQFAFEAELSYVLPYKHPQTPFSADDISYIGKKLRSFFRRNAATKFLIIQYAMFDLRIVRKEFGLPIILHNIWEVTAGEWLLDENSKYLASSPFNTPHGGLDQIFTSYDNDHYKTAEFAKEDRSNASLTQLDNPSFLEYAGMDCQSIWGVHKMQLKRARNLKIGKESFEPYFKRLVIHQMGPTVHALSTMKQYGSSVDKAYLAFLKSNQSPLLELISTLKKDFATSPEVKDVNKRLLKTSGQRSGSGLYGNKDPLLFDLGKYDHKALLFFKVLGLEPVSFTKKEKLPQINKTFIAAYKEDNILVEKFGRYQKTFKLYSTYVKGWWKRIQESIDSKDDFKLRPNYGFFDVVTGRLNSSGPSLQQVPSRGEEAKYIKRAFTAPVGCLHVKFDYSAHEIRVWSYVSGDKVLAETFKVGQKLRQEYRNNPTEETKSRLKVEGDIHISNVKFFFNVVVDKSHFLRDAIKQVVFGVIYMKSAKSLSRDIKPKPEEKEKLLARLKEIDKELSK